MAWEKDALQLSLGNCLKHKTEFSQKQFHV